MQTIPMYLFDSSSEFSDHLESQITSKQVGITGPCVTQYSSFYPSTGLSITSPAYNSRLGSKEFLTSGYSQNLARSRISALAESVERYCASFSRSSVSGTFSELSKSHHMLALESFQPYLQWQFLEQDFKFRNLQGNDPIDWVIAQEAFSNKKTLLPCDYVFLQQRHFQLTLPTSSGLATGESFEQAFNSAMLELVERDAVMYGWWAGYRFPQIIVQNSASTRWHEIAQKYAGVLKYTRIGWATLDLELPIIVCTYFDPTPGRPKFTVSAASHFDFYTCLEKALAELAHLVYFLDYQFKQTFEMKESSFNFQFQSFVDSMRYYAHHGSDETVAKILDSQSTVELDELAAKFSSLKTKSNEPSEHFERLRDLSLRKGLTPYYVDLTTSDAEEIGLTVLRVFEPNLVRLNASHSSRHLNSPRYKRLAEQGFTAKPNKPGAFFNAMPSPFP